MSIPFWLSANDHGDSTLLTAKMRQHPMAYKVIMTISNKSFRRVSDKVCPLSLDLVENDKMVLVPIEYGR